MYVFVLGLELLSIAFICYNYRKIKCLCIDGYEYPLDQYPDYSFLLLGGSETSMRESINVFKHFEYIHGLKLNLSKCEVIGSEVQCRESVTNRA